MRCVLLSLCKFKIRTCACAFAFVRDICVRVRKYNAAQRESFLSFCFFEPFFFLLLASFVRWRNLFSLVVEKQKKTKRCEKKQKKKEKNREKNELAFAQKKAHANARR